MNNPSYKNLGGSGCRCTPYVTLTGTVGSTSAGLTTLNFTATGNLANRMADYAGVKTLLVTWGTGSYPDTTHVCIAQIAGVDTITSTTIVITDISPYQIDVRALPAPTTAITIYWGGPLLMDVSQSGGLLYGSGDIRFLLSGLPQNNGYSQNIQFAGGGDGNGITVSPSAKITFDFGTASGWNYIDFNGYVPFAGGVPAPIVNSPANIPMQKMITEFTWVGSSANSPQGVWDMEASNDGTNYVSMTGGAGFTLANSATTLYSVYPLAPPGGKWTTGYRYYRLHGISGKTQGTNVSNFWLNQINFKIDDYQPQTVTSIGCKDAATLQHQAAIDQCYRVGASPFSQTTWPQGIVYADDFSTGWIIKGGSSGTIVEEDNAVRFGNISINVAGVTGTTLEKSLSQTIDFSNSDVIFGCAIANASDVLVGLGVTIYLEDINGHTMAISPSYNYSSPLTWAGWMPRASKAFNVGPNSEDVIDSGFDITQVINIQVDLSSDAGPTATYVFDSLIFVQKPTYGVIALVPISSGTTYALQLADWVDANYPQVKLTFCNSYTDLDVHDATYGYLSTAYLARQKTGHRMSAQIKYSFNLPCAVDNPLSYWSQAGRVAVERYMLEGIGFCPDDIRVNGVGFTDNAPYDPEYAAATAQYASGHWLPDTTLAASQYVNDYLFAGIDIGGGNSLPDLSGTLKNVMESRSYGIIYGYTAAPGDVTNFKTLISSWLVPALNGSLDPGYAALKMITLGQQINTSPSEEASFIGPWPITATHVGRWAITPTHIGPYAIH